MIKVSKDYKIKLYQLKYCGEKPAFDVKRTRIVYFINDSMRNKKIQFCLKLVKVNRDMPLILRTKLN